MPDFKLILSSTGEGSVGEEWQHGLPKLNRREWEVVLLVVTIAKNNKFRQVITKYFNIVFIVLEF